MFLSSLNRDLPAFCPLLCAKALMISFLIRQHPIFNKGNDNAKCAGVFSSESQV